MTEAPLQETYSLFEEPWWLEALSPGAWGEVKVVKGDLVHARLPFVTRKKYGLTVLGQPPLTHYAGPWIRESTGKMATRLANQKNLMLELIKQLPPHDLFVQCFHPSMTNWLPFYWNGFTQTTGYNYILDDLTDQDRLFSQFDEAVRGQIRKAQKKLMVRDGSIDEVIRMNDMTFQRQGIGTPFDHDLLRRLDAAAAQHGGSVKLVAEDADGRIHGAYHMVYDARSSHGIVNGGDPEVRNSGAGPLLCWEAIRRATQVTKRFDFGGSMIQPIEAFVRNFGATQVPYLKVTGMSRRMRVLMAGRDFAKALLGKA